MTAAAYHHVIRAPGDPYSPGDPEADPPVPVTPAALAGKRGHVRLVASLSSEAAMGHLAGEYSIFGTWPFTLDDTGRWDLDLEPNDDITSPANTVYVEVIVGRGGQESDPLFFLADPAGGDIKNMIVPAPDDLPVSYPTYLVGIDGGTPSSEYGASIFDGGSP